MKYLKKASVRRDFYNFERYIPTDSSKNKNYSEKQIIANKQFIERKNVFISLSFFLLHIFLLLLLTPNMTCFFLWEMVLNTFSMIHLISGTLLATSAAYCDLIHICTFKGRFYYKFTYLFTRLSPFMLWWV